MNKTPQTQQRKTKKQTYIPVALLPFSLPNHTPYKKTKKPTIKYYTQQIHQPTNLKKYYSTKYNPLTKRKNDKNNQKSTHTYTQPIHIRQTQ
jgi:hypothetical protein